MIEPATEKDIVSIHQLFVACTDAMLAAGIGQWHYDYPHEAIIREDVLAGQAFVIREEERCVATITLNTDQDDQYQHIRWRYDSDQVLVIHRLGVHPRAQGKGLATRLCLFAEAFAKGEVDVKLLGGGSSGTAGLHRYDCIRLDAYVGNPVSNRLYEKLGYHLADGLCHFHDNELPFYCYEKWVGE